MRAASAVIAVWPQRPRGIGSALRWAAFSPERLNYKRLGFSALWTGASHIIQFLLILDFAHLRWGISILLRTEGIRHECSRKAVGGFCIYGRPIHTLFVFSLDFLHRLTACKNRSEAEWVWSWRLSFDTRRVLLPIMAIWRTSLSLDGASQRDLCSASTTCDAFSEWANKDLDLSHIWTSSGN